MGARTCNLQQSSPTGFSETHQAQHKKVALELLQAAASSSRTVPTCPETIAQAACSPGSVKKAPKVATATFDAYSRNAPHGVVASHTWLVALSRRFDNSDRNALKARRDHLFPAQRQSQLLAYYARSAPAQTATHSTGPVCRRTQDEEDTAIRSGTLESLTQRRTKNRLPVRKHRVLFGLTVLACQHTRDGAGCMSGFSQPCARNTRLRV